MRDFVPNVLLAAVLAGPLAAAPAAAGEADAPATVLLARTLGPTPLFEDLRELTDSVGGRPTGSPALERGIEWALGRLQAAGLENVHAESYAASRIWLPGIEVASIQTPRELWESSDAGKLRVAAMPLAGSTGPTGLEAGVADVGHGDEAGFAAAGQRVWGRWALVHSEPMKTLDDLFHEYAITPGILERARRAGATGVLWMSTRPGRLLYRHNATLDGSIYPLPAAVIERDGALRIARMVAMGKAVQLKVVLTSESRTTVPMRNVVAEVRGREHPEELVILGAHLDSWDLGRGALDNGCNVALVLDVARQMMGLARAGQRPRRTVRFVLYTGEELGTLGSYAAVRQERAQLDRVKAQVVFDIGSGRTTGFSLGGRADLQAAVTAALAPVADFGPFVHTTDAFVGTDNYDYLVEGVPTLVANQDGPPYLPDYHAESDTYDKVDRREVKLNAAIAAVLAWNLAEAAMPPAPRQSRREVEKLLKDTGLEGQMKTMGLWEGFMNGTRGRPLEVAPPPAQPPRH